MQCTHTVKTIDPNLPKLNTYRNPNDQSPKMTPVIQLFRKGRFYCTAFVIGNNYAITASHCLVNDEGTDRTDDVIDVRLNNKHVTDAKAVGADYRRDLGLIQGDFSKFDMIEVENDHPGFQAGEPLLACGYPGGNKNWTCTTFQPQVNDEFFLRGPGILMPGMSGGPVINLITKKAIGVNCHVYPGSGGDVGGVGISSLYGVLGDFNIEP